MRTVRNPVINVMMAAASKASRKLIRDFGELENLQVSKKGPADFVTAADLRTEKILFEELSKARPGWGFLMEEQGEVAGDDSGDRWIIDPIDGTTNFLHGIPHFAICIAHERNGELLEGLVYNPVYDETFWAVKGEGAHLNDRRLRVSGRTDMSQALFATGIPYKGRPGHDTFLKTAEAVMEVSSGIRRMGSAALDLAYVAAGRYDGYWEQGIQTWDMAAGILLVREAGGYVSDMKGGQKMFEQGSVIAANDRMHGPFTRMLQRAIKA
ncbi:inositol monophosphatase family protein [Magnetospira sp. QH-2]|uniref:inositol monophosphatase family protein n=1 Tax=Magnetospira sp. (strain QH-2) TaxID=1288970 RepID=UPI0003E81B88|nr:inositol monophosphatase family protein [Magnetospira sp. QH-2]CCQ73293.1 Inositol monophosphatase [Magnetospira sp. QH-2]